jgi:hypothetical protein
VDLVASPALHVTPGLSLVARSDAPRQRALFVDGHLVAALDEEPSAWADEATGALPFVLGPRPRVLLLGVGPDLARATTVVEADANLLELSGAPGVVAPPRAFLDATRERWDAILLHVASQDPVRETPLLTVEGLARALACTTEDGVVAASVALAAPPRADARLLRTAERVTPHLVAVRSVDRLTVVLARRAPGADALARATAFAERMGFDLVRPRGPATPPVHRTALGLDDPGPDYPYDLAPVSDARPYFHRFFRWSRLGDLASHEAVPFVEWGFAVLVVGFAQAAVLGALLLIGPLLASRAARAPAPLFLALGAGYMAVEMAWLARGTVLLGSAVPAAAAVIGGFLVGSGLGSLAARRLGGPLRRAALATAVLAVACLLLLPAWGPGIALLAALVAFPMGIPFPTALGRLPEGSVPWALAVNGWAGVTAAAAAPLVSSTWGIPVTAALGGVCYLGVALARPRPPSGPP